MAKLADAPDLGSGAARRVGSTPIIRTKKSVSVNLLRKVSPTQEEDFAVRTCINPRNNYQRPKTITVFSFWSLVFGIIVIPVTIIEPKTNCQRPKTISVFCQRSLVFRLFVR